MLRVRKRVREIQAPVDATAYEEHASIERVAIGRRIDAPVGVRHEGDVTIVPIVEERLVVEKQLVLVEELRIACTRHPRGGPREVNLRREEVVVERLDPVTDQWAEVDVPLQPTPPAQAEADSDAAASAPAAPPAVPAPGIRHRGTANASENARR